MLLDLMQRAGFLPDPLLQPESSASHTDFNSRTSHSSSSDNGHALHGPLPSSNNIILNIDNHQC